MKTLKAKLQGTWNYYGLIGNYRRMQLFYDETCRTLLQVAQPAQSAPEYDVASASTGCWHVSRCRDRALWKRTRQRMPCQRELSFCQRLLEFRLPRSQPAGACESELI